VSRIDQIIRLFCRILCLLVAVGCLFVPFDECSVSVSVCLVCDQCVFTVSSVSVQCVLSVSVSSVSVQCVFRVCLCHLVSVQCLSSACYRVATVSRIEQIIGLFCRLLSLLQGSFAKETYNFIDLTNQSHFIVSNSVC